MWIAGFGGDPDSGAIGRELERNLAADAAAAAGDEYNFVLQRPHITIP